MSDLRHLSFSDGAYAGGVGTNATIPDDDSGSDLALALASPKLEQTEGMNLTTTITVESGTPSLFASAGNWQNGEVEGAYLRVTMPDGAILDTPTPTNAAGEFVVRPSQAGAPADSVLSFGIIDPAPGHWIVELLGNADASSFQYLASTIPTSGGQEMTAVMEELLTYGVESNARFSWACSSCKVASYGLALAITIAVAGASTAILTAESAVVVATAGFLGITAPAALALIAGLVTGGTVTVDFVLTSLCDWLGAC